MPKPPSCCSARVRAAGPTAVLLAVLLAVFLGACSSSSQSTGDRASTNASMSFKVHDADGRLDRPVAAFLIVAKPAATDAAPGATTPAAIDDRQEFRPGTTAKDVVAHYAVLLKRNGWVADRDFVASENSLHFYGISDLAGGSADPRLSVHAATDSDRVPYRDLSPKAR